MGVIIRIETERLLLRPFQACDAEDVFEYLKEPTVNCFAYMKLNSLGEAMAEAEQRAKDTPTKPGMQYAILKREWFLNHI